MPLTCCLWLQRFYLFVEGQAATPGSVAVLRRLPGVRVILRTPDLDEAHSNSRIWGEKWLASFFNKPCNYELFVRQNLNLETAISAALGQGDIGWIVHIDTDELLLPGGTPGYSLQQLMDSVPANVDTLVFPNYESAVERDNVVDPLVEVTLFKRNFDHVIKDVYFGRYKDMTRGNPNYFLTYGNGKAAARLVPGLRPNGAHRFHNYLKPPREAKALEAAVLHYTYARFEDVRSRRGRCQCGFSEEEVKKCFILEFDRWVFRKASEETDDDKLRAWYRQHVVWTDAAFVRTQLANGLFGRIHTPALLVASLDAYAAQEDAQDLAEAAAKDAEARVGAAGVVLGRVGVAGKPALEEGPSPARRAQTPREAAPSGQ